MSKRSPQLTCFPPNPIAGSLQSWKQNFLRHPTRPLPREITDRLPPELVEIILRYLFDADPGAFRTCRIISSQWKFILDRVFLENAPQMHSVPSMNGLTVLCAVSIARSNAVLYGAKDGLYLCPLQPSGGVDKDTIAQSTPRQVVTGISVTRLEIALEGSIILIGSGSSIHAVLFSQLDVQVVASPDILYRVYSLVYTWSLGVIGEKTILCSDGRQAGLNFIDTLDPGLDVSGKIPLGSQTLFIKEESVYDVHGPARFTKRSLVFNSKDGLSRVSMRDRGLYSSTILEAVPVSRFATWKPDSALLYIARDVGPPRSDLLCFQKRAFLVDQNYMECLSKTALKYNRIEKAESIVSQGDYLFVFCDRLLGVWKLGKECKNPAPIRVYNNDFVLLSSTSSAHVIVRQRDTGGIFIFERFTQ